MMKQNKMNSNVDKDKTNQCPSTDEESENIQKENPLSEPVNIKKDLHFFTRDFTLNFLFDRQRSIYKIQFTVVIQRTRSSFDEHNAVRTYTPSPSELGSGFYI